MEIKNSSCKINMRFHYWSDPRIHMLGNGQLHATLARGATSLIDILAYGGRDVRKELVHTWVPESWSVVDLCCGTGTSTRAHNAIGIDTSPAMISEARWRRRNGSAFVVANAETFGDDDMCDVATLFFALHEVPAPARSVILTNAMRLARRRVLVVDISPGYRPSRSMLLGEPYLRGYQQSIVDEATDCTRPGQRWAMHTYEPLPGRVLCLVLSKRSLLPHQSAWGL